MIFTLKQTKCISAVASFLICLTVLLSCFAFAIPASAAGTVTYSYTLQELFDINEFSISCFTVHGDSFEQDRLLIRSIYQDNNLSYSSSTVSVSSGSYFTLNFAFAFKIFYNTQIILQSIDFSNLVLEWAVNSNFGSFVASTFSSTKNYFTNSGYLYPKYNSTSSSLLLASYSEFITDYSVPAYSSTSNYPYSSNNYSLRSFASYDLVGTEYSTTYSNGFSYFNTSLVTTSFLNSGGTGYISYYVSFPSFSGTVSFTVDSTDYSNVEQLSEINQSIIDTYNYISEPDEDTAARVAELQAQQESIDAQLKEISAQLEVTADDGALYDAIDEGLSKTSDALGVIGADTALGTVLFDGALSFVPWLLAFIIGFAFVAYVLHGKR